MDVRSRACLGLMVLGAVSLSAQVEPAATGGHRSSSDDSTLMLTPPPVSGLSYPTGVGSEERSNYLSGGVAVTGGYTDNILPGATVRAVSDSFYVVVPTIGLETNTPRRTVHLSYSPGGYFYGQNTQLDSVQQGASGVYEDRLQPHSMLYATGSYQQNTNPYSLPFSLSGAGGVSGSAVPNGPVVIAPFADNLDLQLTGGYSYQFARNAMVGGAGNFSLLAYQGHNQGQGLFNSKTGAATLFYANRLTRRQYLGAAYNYTDIATSPVSSSTATHLLGVFYTRYFGTSGSISVEAGLEHYASADDTGISAAGWNPVVTVSGGWQRRRANIAASYSRSVSGGQSLLGTYSTESARISGAIKPSRNWQAAISANYMNNKDLTPLIGSTNQSGTTALGTASLQRRINDRIGVELDYSHIYQKYVAIPLLSGAPNGNRAFVTVRYSFQRALGR